MEAGPVSEPGTDGEWITPSVSYVEPQRIACALCGRPIARKYWRTRIEDQVLAFCEPGHADLYQSYWIPTYAKDQDLG